MVLSVDECASIHDMSVVNVPHIHDAHQWQGVSEVHTDTDLHVATVSEEGSLF